ncbi:FlaD/FlaE family flagellar protein [Halostagnicola sp. A-GB9-2]|uniref:FlaD/FlaE family flagellar protein n=1 Tax=Halostagnicola sp. A-GB9-2 TaxID=3048066 RepID=UPI0024C0AA0F|nr:FlaD/FlaE family flagellar protein [Halostagnicola sp. A-GB9-2]MDJ1432165.1 FlaD/FlaE family flagellar protein [Halostagnicola sp. A-GB9-2]
MVLDFSGLGGDDESDDVSGGDDLMGGADDGLMGDETMFADDEDDDSEMEITYQLDEIEKEVESLENKVETVRGENEQISDSITTVEKNVDKLVDLYEIVTEGVNPFAADQEIGNAFDTEEGGMFGGDDDDLGGEIDEEIVDAEANDFLDDEIEDEDEDDGFGDEFDEDGSLEDDEFTDDGLEDDAFSDTLGDDEDASGDDSELDDEIETSALEDDVSEETQPDPSAQSAVNGIDIGENGQVGDPPYLAVQPSRSDAELVTIEWLTFLVETVGVPGAAQTIAYYESVGWISPPVETYLQSMLNGFGDDSQPATEIASDPEPKSVLETDEHKQSLQYIAWIATPEQAPELLTDGSAQEAITQPEQ